MWLFCSLIVRPDDSIFCSVKHDHSHLLVCDYCFTLCPDTSTLSHVQNSPPNLSHTCNCCRLCDFFEYCTELWSWISAQSSSSTLSLHISCHFLHKLLSSVFVQKWAASSAPAGNYRERTLIVSTILQEFHSHLIESGSETITGHVGYVYPQLHHFFKNAPVRGTSCQPTAN